MQDEVRDCDHLVNHRNDILLEGNHLDFTLVYYSDEQAEERLTLQKIVAMVQMIHFFVLLCF